MGVMMNSIWFHLLVNHIPIVGTAIGLGIVIVSLLRTNKTVRRVGLIVYIVTGLMAYPANFSGEAAEKVLKGAKGISADQIHVHEEAAQLALTLTSMTVILAMLHLFNMPPSQKLQRYVFSGIVLIGIASLFQLVVTGHEGGAIRRPNLIGPTPLHTVILRSTD